MRVKVASDDAGQVATIDSVTARIVADAQRSFAAHVDTPLLEQQVHEVVSLLWNDATKVTSFIPVLALRDLRERVEREMNAPRA